MASTQKVLIIMELIDVRVGPKLADLNISFLYVPPNSADQLQPLGLSVKKSIKNKVRFIQWYSKRAAEQLNAGTTVESVSVSLQMSLVKPLNGNFHYCF